MPLWELVALVAGLMSLNALAIDSMLPALGEIADTYKLERANDQQLVIYAYLLGFGAPQLFFGPVTDAYGRRGLLMFCLLGYVAGAFACMLTTSFSFLLLARFLQGIVASGIRVVAQSVIRDLVAGRAMARIMSLIMTVFMIVPIIAPAIGQGIMIWFSWQWTFGVLGIAGLLMFAWAGLRLPETLPAKKRKPLNMGEAFSAYRLVLNTRTTLGYVTAGGIIFGSLFAFIGASEQIFSEVFNEGHRFALWFAVIASSLAVSNLANAALVERYGMRRISHLAMLAFIAFSLINFLAMKLLGQRLEIFIPLFALAFGCFGMMGANFSAIALEPLGDIAGTASAAYGFAGTTVASLLGLMVAGMYDGTVMPILLGFVGLGVAAFVMVLITERGRLFSRGF
jgi:DHA1 family bicyclomycin/chloramphenicol resistance-like MFS transporter